jgi:hypothetical protein
MRDYENRIRISRVKLRKRKCGFAPPLSSLVYNAWNFQSILPQFLPGVLFIDNVISSPLFLSSFIIHIYQLTISNILSILY